VHDKRATRGILIEHYFCAW